jgi:glycosyltransferase involved in cell wall biosynthesis
MRISVAMTTRNAERYVTPLLASLTSQTRLPAELVVHDDASEDGTMQILEAFAGHAPFPVRIERAPRRLGHVAGFLRAAELCEGDAVAFCDHDDVWLDHKLELCGDALERSGAVLALHTLRVVDRELRDIAPPWPAIDSTRLLPPLGFTGLHLDAPGLAMVFDRRLLALADPAGRPVSRYGEGRQMVHDEWVLFLAGVTGSIQLIAEPLALYRQHETNHTGYFQRKRQLTFEPVIDDYRIAAEHTAECAGFLSKLSADDPELAARIDSASRRYRQLADRWELRMALYGAPGRAARARLLGRLMAARAYGSRTTGGFGGRALGKDLVSGVALRARRTV